MDLKAQLFEFLLLRALSYALANSCIYHDTYHVPFNIAYNNYMY